MSGFRDNPDPSIPLNYPTEYVGEHMSLERLPKELKGHEVRYFGRIPVYITTLPAGTLLFRGINHLGSMYDDLLGYKPNIYDTIEDRKVLKKQIIEREIEFEFEAIAEAPLWDKLKTMREALAKADRDEGKEPPPSGERVLGKQYNVFFYPFPMVDSSVGEGYPTVVTYVVPQDVKIATLISPSPYARGIRTSGSFVQTCRGLDPCFTEKFMEKNPDVVGMIAIYAQDSANISKSLPYLNKYFTLYGDVRPKVRRGVPEIILYPRRSFTNTTTIDSKDIAEIVKSIPDLAYIPYHIMEHRSEEKLAAIIDTGLAGKSMTELVGFEDELFIDKTTGFYVSKKYYTGDTSRLVKDRSALTAGEGIFDFPKTTEGPGPDRLFAEDASESYDYLKVLPGWVKKWAPGTNKIWYVETATGKADTTPPLPPGWKLGLGPDNRTTIFKGPDGQTSLNFPYQVGGRRKTLRRRL